MASGKDDHRPGFLAALVRCRQLGAVLVAARLDRITRRAHILFGLLEEGYRIQAADMPGVDDLIMRIYAAMSQQERELISERTTAYPLTGKGYCEPVKHRLLGGRYPSAKSEDSSGGLSHTSGAAEQFVPQGLPARLVEVG